MDIRKIPQGQAQSINTVQVTRWGTAAQDGVRRDCLWNIAKDQAGEGASDYEISTIMQEIIDYNNSISDTEFNIDTVIHEGEQIFLPIEYAIDEINQNVTATNEQYATLGGEVATLEQSVAQSNLAVDTALTELQTAQASLNSIDSTQEGQQAAYNNAQQQVQNAQQKYEAALQEQQQEQAKLEEKQGQLQELKDKLDQYQKELTDLRDEYQAAEDKQQETLDALNTNLDALTRRADDAQRRLTQAQATQQAAQQRQDAAVNAGVTFDDSGKASVPESGIDAGKVLEDGGGKEMPHGMPVETQIADGGRTKIVRYEDGTSEHYSKGEDGEFKDVPGATYNPDGTITYADGSIYNPETGETTPLPAGNNDAGATPKAGEATGAAAPVSDNDKRQFFNEIQSNELYANEFVDGMIATYTELQNKAVAQTATDEELAQIDKIYTDLTTYRDVIDDLSGLYSQDTELGRQAASNDLIGSFKDSVMYGVYTIDQAKIINEAKLEILEVQAQMYELYNDTKNELDNMTPTQKLLTGAQDSSSYESYMVAWINRPYEFNNFGSLSQVSNGEDFQQQVDTFKQMSIENFNAQIDRMNEYASYLDVETVNPDTRYDQESVYELRDAYDAFMSDGGAYTSSAGFLGSRPGEVNDAKEQAERLLKVVFTGEGTSNGANIDAVIGDLIRLNEQYGK